MFNVILYNPEIPSNTGNILRLCANSGAKLHLIKPLGFNLDNKNLKRAGMDYDEVSNINLYNDIDHCLEKNKINKVFALTKFANENAFEKVFAPNDAFIFGNETSGLPNNILEKVKNCIKITGFVNSIDAFTDQAKVINPASELLVKVFNDKGKHTRAAVSVNSLPLGSAVEIDSIFEIN